MELKKLKNKKCIKFLVLPILMVSLIIPLCSFTTSDSEFATNIVYKPRLTCDVGYTYHRLTSTIDKYYSGFIYEFNNTIMGDGKATSIKREACDYVVVGNTSLNYAGATSSFKVPSSYNVHYDYIESSVALYSEDDTVAYFDGRFVFDCLVPIDVSGTSDPLNYVSIFLADDEGDGLHAYSIRDLNCDVAITVHRLVESADGTATVEYKTFTSTIFGSDLSDSDVSKIEGHQGDAIYNTKGFSLSGILYSAPGFSFYSNMYIDKIVLDFAFPSEFDSGRYGFDGFKYCCVTDRLYPQTADNNFYNDELIYAYNKGYNKAYKNGYDEGYDVGYDEGSEISYDKGYSEGVDNAPKEWGGVGQFLVNVLGTFTSAELFPGFTIGGVLSIVAGGLLLLMFLKMFAGG